MITTLHMIILLQHDLVAATEFYQSLGFKLKFKMEKAWAEFTLGDLKIGLCPTKQEPVDRNTGLVFQVDDVKKFYDKHKDTLTFFGEPLQKVHGIMVSVKDPGGNIFDLYQPTPEKVVEMVRSVKADGAGCNAVKNGLGGCCGGSKKCSCKMKNIPTDDIS